LSPSFVPLESVWNYKRSGGVRPLGVYSQRRLWSFVPFVFKPWSECFWFTVLSLLWYTVLDWTMWGSTNERIIVQGISSDPISKIPKVKKAVEVTLLEEHLPSKHKALNSTPSTAKNKTNKEINILQLRSVERFPHW
jgi:hypothetical protein